MVLVLVFTFHCVETVCPIICICFYMFSINNIVLLEMNIQISSGGIQLIEKRSTSPIKLSRSIQRILLTRHLADINLILIIYFINNLFSKARLCCIRHENTLLYIYYLSGCLRNSLRKFHSILYHCAALICLFLILEVRLFFQNNFLYRI